MTGNEAAKLLWDAQEAAGRIARFTAGRSFDDYLADDMLRAAVERQFEIIGEAFAALQRGDPTLAAGIRELPRIIAFRNVLIHAYATVDPKLVWGVIESDLPALRTTLTRLLGQAPGP
jgi:uncharacterized protein with HEPN domain